MLALDGLDLGGAELPATRLALVARDGLVIVLGATVALLPIEPGRRLGVVYTRGIGAGWARVPHTST